MKYGVIDVGSNSVRLMLWEGKTISKDVITTRLAENMQDGFLDTDSINRTARAVLSLTCKAKENGAGVIYIFGTAALRKAKNADLFQDVIKRESGFTVQIVSGETEAEIGALGALLGADGGVIDIGGASSEIVVLQGGKVVFEKSADMGAVTVKDFCGQAEDKAENFIHKQMEIYGVVPKTDFFAIGGTVTTLASISLKLKEYDRNKVNGYILTFDEVKRLNDLLYSVSIVERYNIVGLQKERAEIIPCGAKILYEIMKKYNIDKIRVSESDNLEGYLFKVLKNE